MPFTYCLRPGSTILLAVLFKNCSLLSFVCRSFTYRTVGVSCRHLTSTLPPNSTLEMLSSLLRCSNKARRSSIHMTLTSTVLRELLDENHELSFPLSKEQVVAPPEERKAMQKEYS